MCPASLKNATGVIEKDQGDSNIDDYIVAQQWDCDDQRQADPTFTIKLRDLGDRLPKCNASYSSEATEDDNVPSDKYEVFSTPDPSDFVCPFDKVKVHEHLFTDIKYQA